jgi:hypothetical protein
MNKDAPILKLEGVSDLAISILEKRTGLKLAGLSVVEVKQRVKEWTNSHESKSRTEERQSGDGVT